MLENRGDDVGALDRLGREIGVATGNLDTNDLTGNLNEAKPFLNKLRQTCEETGMSIAELAFSASHVITDMCFNSCHRAIVDIRGICK